MDFTAIIVVPTVMYFVCKFFEALIRRKERMMLVEKLETLHPQFLQIGEAFTSETFFLNKKFSALRIGLLLAGIGLGLTVAWALSVSLFPVIASHKQNLANDFYRFREMFSIIYLASPACFGGIGLIISYLIEKKAGEQDVKVV